MKTFLLEKSRGLVELLSAADIARQLQDKKLAPESRIYDEESSRWLALKAHPDFRAHFEQNFLTPVFKREWYYLVGKTPVGALTYPEMIKLVQTKKIGIDAIIWRHGMLNWAPLARTPEFQPASIKKIHRANLPATCNYFAQRKFHRVPLQAHFVLHDHKNLWRAISIEISAGGAGLVVDSAELRLGQELYLHQTSASAGPQINARVVVVSKFTNGMRPNQARYGVEFSDISSDCQKKVFAFAK